ncbi:MAG: LLM class F420-dependent oxidoreductase [Myxococcales bacterium]|nr:LLM class F420-dependent oxidoreductase [Myxococcales bacterium]
MKLGLSLFATSPETFAQIAKRAEEVGFESVWIPEHLVFPAELPATYPYSKDGRAPVRPGTPLYDPWVTLAFVASATKTIRLGTSVYVLPLRHPLVTARAVTTLDLLSGGRTILGFGVGWLQEEFEIVGEQFPKRGRRSDEIIEILKKLWSEKIIDHHGEFYDLGPLRFEPKSVQKPHPPIVIGGESRAALRRAARLGDGWIGVGGQSLDELARTVEQLRAFRKEFGREAEPLEITTGSRQLANDPDAVEKYREIGVTRLNLTPPLPEGRRATIDDVYAFLDDCGNLAARIR